MLLLVWLSLFIVLKDMSTIEISTLGQTVALFFFNDTAPTEIYTLSLPDALPIPTTARTARWPERREPVAAGRTAPRAREIARARRKNRDGSPGLRPGSGAPPRAAPRAPPW